MIYLHDHIDQTGEFIYWQSNDEPKSVKAIPKAGIVTDGSMTVHAAALYRPYETPPIQTKGRYHSLVYLENE